ncbi:unnamed protein product [Phytomonas sp. Hart1]|nr:unnamed protein product [Phytomonas sp. Hart1]|eukprot:CCW66301.1 unnamed protein product [Phytomonas sp. isolate Hart1]
MQSQQKAGFSERMITLLRHRTEKKPLPKDYMRCPFNAEHKVPIASIVTHIEKAHNGDALGLVEDAMYSRGTKMRLDAFFEHQELSYRSCARDSSSTTDSSFSSNSSSYSVSSQSKVKSLDQKGLGHNANDKDNSRSRHFHQIRTISDETVQPPNFHSVCTPAHVYPHHSPEYSHDYPEQGSRRNKASIFPTPPCPAEMKRPRSTNGLCHTITPFQSPTDMTSPHHAILPDSPSVHRYPEKKDRYIPLRQQYLYGVPDLQSKHKLHVQPQTPALSSGRPMGLSAKSCEAVTTPTVQLETSPGATGSPSSTLKMGMNERVPDGVGTPSEVGTTGLLSLSSQSRQQEDMWRARAIILEHRAIQSQLNHMVNNDKQENVATTAAQGVEVGGPGGDEMWDLWRLLYPHVVTNSPSVAFSNVHGEPSPDSRESTYGINKIPITDFIYYSPRVVLIMESENIKTAFLKSLKTDPVLMAKYKVFNETPV